MGLGELSGERDRVSRERRETRRERDRELVRGRHAACKQTESHEVYDSREGEKETARKREWEMGE